jgi:hypothetical protein
MRARNDGRAMALVLAIGSSMLSCTKHPTSATSPDAQVGPAADKAAADPLAELDSLERQMQQLGLPVAAQRATVPAAEAGAGAGGEGAALDGEAQLGDAAVALEEEQPVPAPTEAAATERTESPPPEKRAERQRCSEVCDLSQAICELEVQICSLSEGHGDDPTYGDACRRAGEDCDTADTACDRCS